MQTIDARITSQGQITIPVEVRRHLGLAKGAKVSFVIAEDGVRLVPVRHTLESIAGAVEPIPGTSTDFDAEIEEAMSDEADRRLGLRRDE